MPEILTHITKGTLKAYYNYDSEGQRVRKVVEKEGGIREERLYLNGFEIFRRYENDILKTERETLHIMDDKSRIATVDTLTVNDGQTVSEPVCVQRYQLNNNIDSATLELDENASIISYEEYYPYGETSYRAGSSVSEVSQKRYRYTGKEKDEEIGLYYFGARYYICWLGLWTSIDPKLQFESLYLYAGNGCNPVNGVDRDGGKIIATGKDQEKYAEFTSKLNKEQAALIYELEISDVTYNFSITDEKIKTDKLDTKTFEPIYANGEFKAHGDGTERTFDINIWKGADFKTILHEFIHGVQANEYLQTDTSLTGNDWEKEYKGNELNYEREAHFEAEGIIYSDEQLREIGYGR